MKMYISRKIINDFIINIKPIELQKYYNPSARQNRLAHIYSDIKCRTNPNSTWLVAKRYVSKGIKNEFNSFNEFIDECLRVGYVEFENKWNEENLSFKTLHLDRLKNEENYKVGNVQFLSTRDNVRKNPKPKKLNKEV